jgi:hypothetical protein
MALPSSLSELKQALTKYHNHQDHVYQDDPENPGSCVVCGWLDPCGPKLECGHTLREHGEQWLKELEEVDSALLKLVVAITVIEQLEQLAPPSRRRFFN